MTLKVLFKAFAIGVDECNIHKLFDRATLRKHSDWITSLYTTGVQSTLVLSFYSYNNSRSCTQTPQFIRVTYSASQTSIWSLRYHKGDGGENAQKVNSRSLKLHCDYHNSLTLSNVGKLFWSWILKKFKFRERKRNLSSYVQVVDETWNLAIHFVVAQWRQRNVQKSVVHVQSCCFANLNLLLFWRSRCPRRCVRETWNLAIHFVVVQWRQRNVQKSVVHVQSCYFANLNLLLSWRSRCPRRSVILSYLMCKGALLHTQTKLWKFYLFNRLLASGRNSVVLPFKWNLFGSTFTWYYLFCM